MGRRGGPRLSGVREARLVATDAGLVPEGEGWFVVNAREARWARDVFARDCAFEGDARFGQIGVRLTVLEPGRPNCMYHREEGQEDFLVLSGECLLLVEGEERRLRRWDLVHCPPWTDHVFVGAGDGPCVVLMIGNRVPQGVVYPVSELAARHGASVPRETDSPAAAYAGLPEPELVPYRPGDLEG